MNDFKCIKAILFDSGRVLNYPRTGHWFVPPNFFNYVNKERFESTDSNLINKAFEVAKTYIESIPIIMSESEEYEHFKKFYNVIAEELTMLELKEKDVCEIAKDTVYNDDKFLFYEDVFEVIPQLSKRFMLGVISDTWPSLDRVYKNVGLRDYFSTFVMSSKIGVVKPHEQIYRTALSELGVSPAEALFIDDNLKNLEGARDIGMNTLLMLRGETPSKDHVCINNLKELLIILQK
jgi:putative hydrolase of the HAD superfamily